MYYGEDKWPGSASFNPSPFGPDDESQPTLPEDTPGSAPRLSVSEFIATCNQTLEYAFNSVQIVGEVASFKINQGKWVFFDLKDQDSSISCFLPVWELRMPLEDGMKVVVMATPKLTKWGKFSLTVRRIMPLGEGNIKKSLELLKQKLAKEGLFDPAKKRPLPSPLHTIGVISSTQAAGYADFIKILGERWGGLQLQVAHTQVQGLTAADQIIRALNYFNERSEVQVVAIIRGGGSADDLSAFNDEKLARTIAASKIPVITGIGHEVDESLADLVADIRASTPSNVAQLLTRDRHQAIAQLHSQLTSLHALLSSKISQSSIANSLGPVKTLLLTKLNSLSFANHEQIQKLQRQTVVKITTLLNQLHSQQKILEALNPDKVLKQGYAILKGKISPGAAIEITTLEQIIKAEIKDVKLRK